MKIDIFNTEKEYHILYADPPWKQSKGGKKAVRERTSGVPLDYNVLSLGEIADLIKQADRLTKDNGVMFLWAIDKYLFEAQEIGESLGDKLHARMIWDKMNGIPAAFTVRYGHEYLLYMYKGKLMPVAKDERGKIHTVFSERAKRHSQKPVIAYEIIERLYPETKKLELFARNKRQGWDCWGNQV